MVKYEKNGRVIFSLRLLEQSIKGMLPDCKLWGDIPYTKEDYLKLHELLVAYVEEETKDDPFNDLMVRFPYCTITDLIRFLLYEYDGDAIWPIWFNQFNVEATGPLQSKVGQTIRRIFELNNLEIVEDGGLKYLTPILYQAGVPNFTLRRFYDVLYYTIGSPYFNELEFYEEVTGYRSYILDRTGVRYFKEQERALDLISEVRSIIEFADGYESMDEFSSDHEFKKRYLEEFFYWKKYRKSASRSSNGRNFYYVSPKLIYDEFKGVCIKLPPQIISDDSIDMVLWMIKCEDNGEKLDISLPVFYENRLAKIEEQVIPVPPSSLYVVMMYNEDDLSKEIYNPWNISGVNSDVPYLIFSNDSRSTQQSFLSLGGNLLIRHKDTYLDQKASLNNHQQIDLPAKWKDYRADFISPKDETVKVQISYQGNCKDIEVRRYVGVELVQLSTLFDEDYGQVTTPVYVSFPMFEVQEVLSKLEHHHYQSWKLTLRNRTTNYREECSVSECLIKGFEHSTRFSFPSIVKSNLKDQFGEYELRIQMGRNLQVLNFYYVPNVEYQGELIKDVNNAFLNNLTLRIKESEDIKIELEKENRIEVEDLQGHRWIKVDGQRGKAFIRGKMIINIQNDLKVLQVPFRKRTGKLEWKFWNEEENKDTSYGMQYFEDEEIVNSNWMCLMSLYGDETYVRVTLESGITKEIYQERYFYKDQKGTIKIPLSGFYDTMRSEKLPQKIMCYLGEHRESLCLGVIRKIAQLHELGYLTSNGIPYLAWSNKVYLKGKTIKLTSVSEPSEKTESMIIENIQILRTKYLPDRYVLKLPFTPHSGLYMVELDDEFDDFFFEEEAERSFLVDSDKLISVKRTEPLLMSSLKTIGDWAKAYLSALGNNTEIKKIHVYFEDLIKRVEYTFTKENDLEVFIRLVNIVLNSKYLDENIASILRQFFKEVNIRFITPKDRAMLLKRILQGNISKDVFIKLEYELQLFLVEKNDQELLNREEMRRLWQLDEKLAILVSLRGGTERSEADAQKIINHLNAPMIKKTIQFQPQKQCETQEWVDCFGYVIMGRCRCPHSGFPATEKLWGDINDFKDAIVINRNHAELKKLSEIPSDGYEFLGSNYLSLCYRWLSDDGYNDKKLWREAMKYAPSVRDLAGDKLSFHKPILRVIEKRTDGNNETPHMFFYCIGIGSILEASGKKNSPMKSELRKVHQFWDYAFRAFPKLVMRDMIISEMYMKFN